MAGTRQYRRKSNGQFAGASGGTKVTTGRSGGFANASFRARVAQNRQSTKLRKGKPGVFMRAVKNKGVQKAAVHLAIAGGISVYNRRKFSIKKNTNAANKAISRNRAIKDYPIGPATARALKALQD